MPDQTVTTAGVQAIQGLATVTDDGGTAIQVAPAGVWTQKISGGVIVNPLTAFDQGLGPKLKQKSTGSFSSGFSNGFGPFGSEENSEGAKSLFYDFTGPAYSHVTATTEGEPGANP